MRRCSIPDLDRAELIHDFFESPTDAPSEQRDTEPCPPSDACFAALFTCDSSYPPPNGEP